jgi:hypothetical protein
MLTAMAAEVVILRSSVAVTEKRSAVACVLGSSSTRVGPPPATKGASLEVPSWSPSGQVAGGRRRRSQVLNVVWSESFIFARKKRPTAPLGVPFRGRKRSLFSIWAFTACRFLRAKSCTRPTPLQSTSGRLFRS